MVSNIDCRMGNTYLIAAGIQVRQKFAVDEVLCVVDNRKHNGLWHHISRCFRNDFHVGIDQVADCFNLALQLWI